MFFDEKLENEWIETNDVKKVLLLVANEWKNENFSLKDWLNAIKRTDSSWRIFAKRHPNEINPDMVKELLRNCCTSREVFELLNWK